ncbi:hypothetical protein H0H92_002394 [Tricholoma furcatifolium]|nr:hypothetical protein H0H92_002394 [Tricholoma furcatifolium]
MQDERVISIKQAPAQFYGEGWMGHASGTLQDMSQDQIKQGTDQDVLTYAATRESLIFLPGGYPTDHRKLPSPPVTSPTPRPTSVASRVRPAGARPYSRRSSQLRIDSTSINTNIQALVTPVPDSNARENGTHGLPTGPQTAPNQGQATLELGSGLVGRRYSNPVSRDPSFLPSVTRAPLLPIQPLAGPSPSPFAISTHPSVGDLNRDIQSRPRAASLSLNPQLKRSDDPLIIQSQFSSSHETHDTPPSPLSSLHLLPLPSSSADHYRKKPQFHEEYPYANLGSDVDKSPSNILRRLAGGDSPVDSFSQLTEEQPYLLDEDDEHGYHGSLFSLMMVHVSLLSHLAIQLKDKIPRTTHTKGGIQYDHTFTGKDIITTIHFEIHRELVLHHGLSINDRRAALHVAKSLQNQLFFSEVEWDEASKVQDNVEHVYTFVSDSIRREEDLPSGVMTILTRCYSPRCTEGVPCYSYTCPRRGALGAALDQAQEESHPVPRTWETKVGQRISDRLTNIEVRRQNTIYYLVEQTEHYVRSLEALEIAFLLPLRVNLSFIRSDFGEFISVVFERLTSLRQCHQRFIEAMHIREREQGLVVKTIGDIVFEAVVDFRALYTTYLAQYPAAEKRLKDEVDNNVDFRLFIEECSRRSAQNGMAPTVGFKDILSGPSEYLQKLQGILQAILKKTDPGNADHEALEATVEAIKSLQAAAQLATFQTAMGKGTPGKWEWHDLVSAEDRDKLSKSECKRQAIMFELIKGEMAYVQDLENIGKMKLNVIQMYIVPLRTADPPIIPPERLNRFVDDVFHNYRQIYDHHRRLLNAFLRIQEEQHPVIGSIIEPLMHAAIQFRDAYREYIPNYPIAAHRINEELEKNPAFKEYVEACIRHPDADRLDMKNFINRPIPRLLRYELLLKGILKETPEGSEDLRRIPNAIDLIKSLGKETEPGVAAAKQKVELWRIITDLVFKPGESVDLDLWDDNRSLFHAGKLFRQQESGLEWNGWAEVLVILFDNYLVVTKPKERDGVVKYHAHRRPIPLDLLTLVKTSDAPVQRNTRLLSGLRGERTPDSAENSPVTNDSRFLYPLTFHHRRTGGSYVLYAESPQARLKWKKKLDEAFALRKVIQESNRAFGIRTLGGETYFNAFTGNITCSTSFRMPDGRSFVAIGCSEGVWIGVLQSPESMRRVLQLKMVTQCAMLEEFNIFIVLADKSLFAYRIESLIPSYIQSQQNRTVHVSPQRVTGGISVQFFSVGTIQGRTLVIYMRKKGSDSQFVALEPNRDKIKEISSVNFGLGAENSEWFRFYKDFVLPSDSYNLFFLKARLVIACAKGFESVDLDNLDRRPILKSIDPRSPIAKRCETSRAIAMFRSSENEFLLCYTDFGLYVDRHGAPSREGQTIEWEGTAERVALHAPHILIFDPRFIEIRDIASGRLKQIIPGIDVRCTWDGRNANTIDATPGDLMTQDNQVHAVIVASPGKHPSNTGVQHVVALMPTLQLQRPGLIIPHQRQISFPINPSPLSPRRPPDTARFSIGTPVRRY